MEEYQIQKEPSGSLVVRDWRNRGPEVRVRESGKPKGEAGIRIQGAVSNSGSTGETRKNGSDSQAV